MDKMNKDSRGQVSVTSQAAAALMQCKKDMSEAVGSSVSYSQVVEYLLGYEAGRVRKLVRVSVENTDART